MGVRVCVHAAAGVCVCMCACVCACVNGCVGVYVSGVFDSLSSWVRHAKSIIIIYYENVASGMCLLEGEKMQQL